jgi:cytochrome c peroxidase
MTRFAAAACAVALVLAAGSLSAAAGEAAQNPQRFLDSAGLTETYSTSGSIATGGAFFQSLGTNGRSCSTCHVANQAFSISASNVRQRFFASAGHDVLFAPIDGANCPTARGSNPANHSLLLTAGLIRIPLPILSNAQFTLSVVHDPYGCSITPDASTGQPDVSVYRRPLPTTNLSFLSAVMFDGRETIQPLTNSVTFMDNLVTDLTHQATDATLIHAQAAQGPSASQLADIVDFELGLFTAQGYDFFAGELNAQGAAGGSKNAAALSYYPGINDVLGADPTGASFNPASMGLFAPWANLTGGYDLLDYLRNDARRQIAAGEALFNTTPITITNVRGLNDNAALGKPTSFVGHCTSCHDTPNVGNHSLPLPLDIGTSHSPLPGLEVDPAIVAALAELSMPNLPVYLINGCPNPFTPGQPASFYTSDPGKALITGNCSDLNRVKGPILRGLAARAPYFHNGAAASLTEVVNFYNQRFGMRLTDEQKNALVAFLNSL